MTTIQQARVFTTLRPGYLSLTVDKTAIKSTIYEHPEFAAFIGRMNALFDGWQQQTAPILKALQPGFHPKHLIVELSENLLAHYTKALVVDDKWLAALCTAIHGEMDRISQALTQRVPSSNPWINSSPKSARSNKAPCRNCSPASGGCRGLGGSGRLSGWVMLANASVV